MGMMREMFSGDGGQEMFHDPMMMRRGGGISSPISLLLNFGADPTLPDEDGNTPLHLAVRFALEARVEGSERGMHQYASLIDIVVLLLCNGCDLMGPANNDQLTPYIMLGEENAPGIIERTEAITQLQIPFLQSCEAGQLKEVLQAIQGGVLAGYQDPDGHTGLYFAVQQMHTEVVRCLLQHRANVNHATKDGTKQTPLHMAVKRSLRKELATIEDRERALNIVQMLAESTRSVSNKDSEGKNALEIALDNNWLAAAWMLLQASPDRELSNGGVNEAVENSCKEAFEQHKASYTEHLELEAAKEKNKKREEKLAWDRQACKKSLMNGLNFSSKLSGEAIEACGTDVDKCVAWIKERQAQEKQERDEKDRLRREKKAASDDDESDSDGSGSDNDSSSDGGRVWSSEDEDDEDQEEALVPVKSMVPKKIDSLMEERAKKILDAQKILCVNTTVVANLLPIYKWKPDALVKAWYNDPDKVLKDARIELVEESEMPLPENPECGLFAAEGCTGYEEDPERLKDFETKPSQYFTSLKCGHVICNACWGDYLTSKIVENDIMMLRCPICVGGSSSTCSPAVPESMVERVVPPEVYTKFQNFVVSNYISTQPAVKWCPAPNCGFVVSALHSNRFQEAQLCRPVNVEKDSNSTVSNNMCIEATCGDGHTFCFNCMSASHAPVTCANVKDWDTRNSDDGGNETNTWILSNTRPCPGCGMRLEKNAGCSHMKCGSHAHGGKMSAGHGCGLDFCWNCMVPNDKHDYTACSRLAQEINKKEILAKDDGKEAELVNYLSAWKQWKVQADEKKWMMDATDDILAKLEEMKVKSHNPNTLSICDTVNEAITRVLQCRDALAWCEVQYFYCDRETTEFALFEKYLSSLKKIVLQLVMQLQLPWQEYNLAVLTDNLKLAERVFNTV